MRAGSPRFFSNVFGGFLVVLSFVSSRPTFAANSDLLDSLSGTWSNFQDFVSVGQCSAAPTWTAQYLCNPASLASLQEQRFEAAGFITATASVLSLAETLRQNSISSSDITSLFQNSNYSDLLVSAQLYYVQNSWIVGVRPLRVQGQFQLHNPNLPLGSLTYRDEVDVFGGYAVTANWLGLKWSLGAITTFMTRKEVLAEANLISFAQSPQSVEQIQRQNGVFTDVGFSIELRDHFVFSVVGRDLGGFVAGQDTTGQYLFINQDRQLRTETAIAFIPRIWHGNLQIGAELISFLNLDNSYADQVLGTASYYVGPFQLLSGFRPGLFRTGIDLRFSSFEVSVAQEWINTIEVGRNAQPRFILGLSAGL